MIAWQNHCLHLSCDNVHFVVTLNINVGQVTLQTSDPLDKWPVTTWSNSGLFIQLHYSVRKRRSPRFTNRHGSFRRLSHIIVIIAVFHIKLLRLSPTVAVGFRVRLQFLVACVSAIYTAAMEMLGGGESVKTQCRRPDIMADAAYAVLTSDSRTYTGNFDIDEDVLRRNGVTDFQKYSYYEGKHCSSGSSSSSCSCSSSCSSSCCCCCCCCCTPWAIKTCLHTSW